MMTVVDVVGRYAFNRPLSGGSELIEIFMAVLIYAGLPVTSERNAHISVDLLDPVVPKALVRPREAFVHLLCSAILAVIAWRLWIYAGQLTRDVTEYLKIPQAPVVYVLSVFSGIASVVEIYRAFRPVSPQEVFTSDPA